MKPQVVLRMSLDPRQTQALVQLQEMFAQACNHLSPIVQQTRCWNRVALHHMAYRTLRAQFPALGSQMACNAIYSVARTCRALFQNRDSPYALHKLGSSPLPRVLFLPQSPVYFDRHTLSLKDNRVSMYTLDGRIKFQLKLDDEQEALFRAAHLREIVMTTQNDGLMLTFNFDDGRLPAELSADAEEEARTLELPEYVMVLDDQALPAITPPIQQAQPKGFFQ